MTGKRWFLAGLFASLALILAAGCGDDDDDDDDDDDVDTPAGDDDDAGDGGETIDISGVEELEDGTLTILTNVPYPPLEFLDDEGELTGFSIELSSEVAARLGVEAEFTQTGFDAILEELNAGDGDIVVSSVTITEDRDEQVDFVPYLSVGVGIAVAAGNPEGIASLEDLCGLAVSAQEATIQEDQLRALNEDQCADDQIELVILADQALVTQELVEGTVDAMMADLPVTLDAAATFPDEVEDSGYNADVAPYGIAYVTDSSLGAALQAALDAIIADGTYDALLAEWGLEAAALQE